MLNYAPDTVGDYDNRVHYGKEHLTVEETLSKLRDFQTQKLSILFS